MSEFEAAKQRWEKKHKNVVPIQPEPVKPKDSVTITIVDDGTEYRFEYTLDGIKQTRLSGQRGEKSYKDLLGAFITKEFGRWRSRPTT